MKSDGLRNGIVFTNKARCRDCYRCVRACPVKAIKMEDAQANVEDELCIHCGTCIRECPQGAKQYKNEIEKVKALLKGDVKPAVSIAPSFAGFYNSWETKRIPSALRKLGFVHIAETAVGAYYSAKLSLEYIESGRSSVNIASACPAIINYIEKYQPKFVNSLIPVNSPMIAHAKAIKQKFGGNKPVVFIGPCIAKKGEAEREEYEGLIDAVLTFEELADLFEEEEIIPGRCEESGFDEIPAGNARLYALAGGQSKTVNMDSGHFSTDVVAISGYDEIRDLLESVDPSRDNIIIEPLFCNSGCINGPGSKSEKKIFDRKKSLLKYNAEKEVNDNPEVPDIYLTTEYKSKEVAREEFTEEEIKKVLAKTGKTTPEDELNCGACGYLSCRDKAKAVLKGMAEHEMCIPYVRRMAEQRTDKIIESSPNGIVILDDELKILSMNPAFKRFFMCSDSVCGKNISYLMDPEPFVELASKPIKMLEATVQHDKYNIVCHQKMYMLQEDNQYVGIFVNITKNISDREMLDELRNETITQARELLDHQINMAQNLAKVLGENTARGEKLVENLLKLSKDDNDKNSRNDNRWLMDLYSR